MIKTFFSLNFEKATINDIDEYIQHGANINECDQNHRTPLMLFSQNSSNESIIEKLINLGANINETDSDGWTALFYAAYYNENPSITKKLLEFGANTNIKSKIGFYPIYFAAKYNSNILVLKNILNYTRNIEYEKLMDAAKKNGNDDVFYFFKNNIQYLQALSNRGKALDLFNKISTSYYKILNDKQTQFNKLITRKQIVEEKLKYKNKIEEIVETKFNRQQYEAIFNDDAALLVVAGAGCGKTTTVLGKIVYLLLSGKAKPNEILPIYFNTNNKNEMNIKMQEIGIKIQKENPSFIGQNFNIAHDYHSLGLSIITEKGSVNVNTEAFQETINNWFSSQDNTEHFEWLLNLYEYVSCYMSSEDEQALHEYLQKSEDIEELSMNLNDLKKKYELTCITLDGKNVKSPAEAFIANFLIEHKIKYEYEEQYKNHYPNSYPKNPDFFIPINENDPDIQHTQNCVWIEHWGIMKDEAGNEIVPWLKTFEAKQKYIDDKEKKEEDYNKDNANVISVYLSEYKNGTITEVLTKQLEKYGIDTTKKITDEEKIDLIIKLIETKKLSKLIKKIERFISLYKTKTDYPKNICSFFEIFLSKCDKKNYDKYKCFEGIVVPIYEDYINQQENEIFIDYTDMLLQAIPLVENNNIQKHYKYIFIDEYQDIDELNYQLIDAVHKQTNAKICCVGDDWQSIYRFKGADINFFNRFSDYFKKGSEIKIEQTFRNNNPLLKIAGDFIMKNPNQKHKELFSKENPSKIIACLYSGNNDRYELLLKIIKQINKNDPHKSVLLLMRNNDDYIRSIKKENIKKTDVSQNINYEKIFIEQIKDDIKNKFDYIVSNKIKIYTIHTAKGLESDYVIIYNMSNSLTGFPNQLPEDKIFSALLPKQEDFPNAEERRLFYVALTRAKQNCYLLIPYWAQSSFYKNEIKKDIPKENIFETNEVILHKCPKCDAHLEQRTNQRTGEKFLTCTRNGCGYSKQKIYYYFKKNEALKRKPNREALFLEFRNNIFFEKDTDNSIKLNEIYQNKNKTISEIRNIDTYIYFSSEKDKDNQYRHLLDLGLDPCEYKEEYFTEDNFDDDLIL